MKDNQFDLAIVDPPYGIDVTKNRPKVKTYIRNNTRDTRRTIPSSRI